MVPIDHLTDTSTPTPIPWLLLSDPENLPCCSKSLVGGFGTFEINFSLASLGSEVSKICHKGVLGRAQTIRMVVEVKIGAKHFTTAEKHEIGSLPRLAFATLPGALQEASIGV